MVERSQARRALVDFFWMRDGEWASIIPHPRRQQKHYSTAVRSRVINLKIWLKVTHKDGGSAGSIETTMSELSQSRHIRDVRGMSASPNSRHGDDGSVTAQVVQSPSSMRFAAGASGFLTFI